MCVSELLLLPLLLPPTSISFRFSPFVFFSSLHFCSSLLSSSLSSALFSLAALNASSSPRRFKPPPPSALVFFRTAKPLFFASASSGFPPFALRLLPPPPPAPAPAVLSLSLPPSLGLSPSPRASLSTASCQLFVPNPHTQHSSLSRSALRKQIFGSSRSRFLL